MSPAVRKAPAQLYLAFVRVPRMPGQAHAYMGPGAGFAHAKRRNESPHKSSLDRGVPPAVGGACRDRGDT